jgi:hypothetical protein
MITTPTPSREAGEAHKDRGPKAQEIRRRVQSNGVVCVAYYRFSVGQHYAGKIVRLRIEPTLIHVYHRKHLIRTVPRHTRKEIVQLGNQRPRTRRKTG